MNHPHTIRLLVLLALAVGGCAAGGADLADAGRLDVELAAAGSVRFSKPSVSADDGRLVVAGRVHAPSRRRTPLGGRVRAELVSPEGQPLATAVSGDLRGGGGPPPVRRPPPASYRVIFDSVPPDGSTVRLSMDRPDGRREGTSP